MFESAWAKPKDLINSALDRVTNQNFLVETIHGSDNFWNPVAFNIQSRKVSKIQLGPLITRSHVTRSMLQ